MSDTYDWGSPAQPAQPAQPAGGAGDSGGSGNSDLGKKISIGAIAVVAVAALGVGGFQVFKATQAGAPNPIGITDDVAHDLVRAEFDDCMLTPELIAASGIKDLEKSEQTSTLCTGYFAGPGGNNNVEVTIAVEQFESPQTERSDIEGWREFVQDSYAEQDANFTTAVESLNSGSNGYDEPNDYCILVGDERETQQIQLTGPTCESLAPLANQIMNVVKQDIYNSSDADFFEIKDKPTYVETQPTGTVDVTLPGFREAYDSVPELGTEMDSLQKEFNNSKIKINDVGPDPDGYYDVCFFGEFTLGERKEDRRSRFIVPSLDLIASNGETLETSRSFPASSMDVGETEDVTYCADYSTSRNVEVTDLEYVAVFSDFVENGYSTDSVYSRDGVPNAIAKWSQAQGAPAEEA